MDFVDGNGVRQISSITFIVNTCGYDFPRPLNVSGGEVEGRGERKEE